MSQAQVVRIIHMRAPVIHTEYTRGFKKIVRRFVGHELADQGGATVMLQGVPGEDKVQVKVAWCRFSDSYTRKKGIETAAAKDPEVVHLRHLPSTLSSIQDQMLSQVSVYLRHNEEERHQRLRDWNYVIRQFLPAVETCNG